MKVLDKLLIGLGIVFVALSWAYLLLNNTFDRNQSFLFGYWFGCGVGLIVAVLCLNYGYKGKEKSEGV